MNTTNSCQKCGGNMTGQVVSVHHTCMDCRFILERELENQLLRQKSEYCGIIGVLNQNETQESVNSSHQCHLG
ncbi:hypothetical protein AVI51_11290 [Piscirickettsia salmonis]|uniref:hypothetical protein n=2 Tax=Piscirickettsia salmonis TaxID=1238 RepID=UPI00031E8F5D|nr:hypothetical protein [Piscirickettsia salmonis]ALA26403.1 hypothetical protein KW89_2944 [Piscirickettsia salmonis]APS43829.1 hypothetical protein AVI48_05210 [Piscirickettsia salmonis]APS47183.1 hypothetical protein AVI49_05810 [Piscirickettsia salmonis]APS51376.1 hypothetical protein AVI50_11405 [Piscirickettsia salmonis]APS54586.1 hypothetical protein AVI51_11290 [Piscirickettsia salmonis]